MKRHRFVSCERKHICNPLVLTQPIRVSKSFLLAVLPFCKDVNFVKDDEFLIGRLCRKQGSVFNITGLIVMICKQC